MYLGQALNRNLCLILILTIVHEFRAGLLDKQCNPHPHLELNPDPNPFPHHCS